MEKVALFEKVSSEQFLGDLTNDYGLNEEEIKQVYMSVKMPHRATKGSAGYDFYAPFDIVLKPNESIKVPTGIRCKIADGWVLAVFPRSSLGFKYRVQLDNTVGIIDADYYNAKNEGHIMVKISNDGYFGKEVEIKAGTAFCQGIFLPFGITEDDDADGERIGGFGSTNK